MRKIIEELLRSLRNSQWECPFLSWELPKLATLVALSRAIERWLRELEEAQDPGQILYLLNNIREAHGLEHMSRLPWERRERSND